MIQKKAGGMRKGRRREGEYIFVIKMREFEKGSNLEAART